VPNPRRALSMMGDGGFWHNGLTSGIGNAVFNRHDGVTIIVDNGYSAATGGQYIPSSSAEIKGRRARNRIETAVRGVGVEWVRTIRTYDMKQTMGVLREALLTKFTGPKIVIAEGECQLNRQRRVAPAIKKMVGDGKRVVRERFGIDADVCTGDHSCIRLSGCPSLTVKTNPDPLRRDPVAYVDNSCVGCGVCGEVAHAAVLCPSFYRADVIVNPSAWDRLKARLRSTVIAGWREAIASDHPHHRGFGRARRRGRDRLAGHGSPQSRLLRPSDIGARRRAAHGRNHLLHGVLSARRRPGGLGTGDGVDAESR